MMSLISGATTGATIAFAATRHNPAFGVATLTCNWSMVLPNATALLSSSDGKTGGALFGDATTTGGGGAAFFGASRSTKGGGAFLGTSATTGEAFFGTSTPGGGAFKGDRLEPKGALFGGRAGVTFAGGWSGVAFLITFAGGWSGVAFLSGAASVRGGTPVLIATIFAPRFGDFTITVFFGR
jgi:hypothetical protein